MAPERHMQLDRFRLLRHLQRGFGYSVESASTFVVHGCFLFHHYRDLRHLHGDHGANHFHTRGCQPSIRALLAFSPQAVHVDWLPHVSEKLLYPIRDMRLRDRVRPHLLASKEGRDYKVRSRHRE